MAASASLDNLRLTDDADTTCQHLLGMVAGNDILAADNGINSPAGDNTSAPQHARRLERPVGRVDGDGARRRGAPKGWCRIPEYCSSRSNSRATVRTMRADASTCRVASSRTRARRVNGGNGTTTGYGYAKQYDFDECSVNNPLPYFPTTGRFTSTTTTRATRRTSAWPRFSPPSSRRLAATRPRSRPRPGTVLHPTRPRQARARPAIRSTDPGRKRRT